MPEGGYDETLLRKMVQQDSSQAIEDLKVSVEDIPQECTVYAAQECGKRDAQEVLLLVFLPFRSTAPDNFWLGTIVLVCPRQKITSHYQTQSAVFWSTFGAIVPTCRQEGN